MESQLWPCIQPNAFRVRSCNICAWGAHPNPMTMPTPILPSALNLLSWLLAPPPLGMHELQALWNELKQALPIVDHSRRGVLRSIRHLTFAFIHDHLLNDRERFGAPLSKHFRVVCPDAPPEISLLKKHALHVILFPTRTQSVFATLIYPIGPNAHISNRSLCQAS